jgi:hypothetical protein
MVEAKLPSLPHSQAVVAPVPNPEDDLPPQVEPCEVAPLENHLQPAEEMVHCDAPPMPMAEPMPSAAAEMQAPEEMPLSE